MIRFRNYKLMALPQHKKESVIYWINWVPDSTKKTNQSPSAYQVLVI
jgi:hypothetical protein